MLAVAILVLCASIQLVYLAHVFVSLISLYKIYCQSCVFLFQHVIFAEIVYNKLENILQKSEHGIVVLSIAFRTAGFHTFSLYRLGLVTFAVKILRFHSIFT